MSKASGRIRVAVESTALLTPRTGVGQMVTNLLTTLSARDDLEVSAFAVTLRGRGALAYEVPRHVRARTRHIPARLTRMLWRHLPIPRAELWTGRVDIVHAPNFVAPPARAPVIATVHDLTFVWYPELSTPDTLTFPRYIQLAIDRGAVLHVVSDFVASEVRDHFDIEPERVVRVYSGLVPSAGGDPARGRRLAGSDRYVLALGTVEPRKNLPNLVKAFDAVAGDDPDLVLLVAGPDGWGVEDFDAAVDDARHGERIRRLGYVDDHDRRDLLAGATVLAYPSIYEGFGHPPLEAMLSGIPVVASNAGALPEVLGDAALLPDPNDVDALAGALHTVLSDGDVRAQLIARGHERVKLYTWDRAGAEFADLYRQVTEGGPANR
ncbi:MAG: glycosyltransferase family 4 protein [Actinobacteria bacterium]|nr:glycosyltransferase family 4 protein [Actinomycetota bacterium]